MHEKLARKAGLSPAIIEALAQGREPAGMAEDEALVYRASAQAHATGRLDDPSKNVSAAFDWPAHALHLSFDGRKETLPLEPGFSTTNIEKELLARGARGIA